MNHRQMVYLLNMLKEHKELEMVRITDLDIIYNHYMNDGEWEVFDSNSDHTVYEVYDDVDELADLILDYI